MKTVALFVLLTATVCGFGQTNTNLMAAGEWSQPTNGVSGRLLFGERSTWKDGTRVGAVYLELRNASSEQAVYVYYNPKNSPLHCELKDSSGKDVAPSWGGSDWAPEASWVALRKDSTARLDASLGPAFAPTGPNFLFTVGMAQMWVLPVNATNDFFLSGVFTVNPRKGENREPRWEGTLSLPPVRIRVNSR